MSAVASLSVSHVAAHAAVTSRSSRATSASSSTFPRRVHDSQRKTSQSRRSSRMHAVSEPVTIPAAPSGGEQDPAIAAYIADQMIDEAVMLASSTFPIAPEELIAKTKGILATNNGANDPARLAADFNFVAPVIGPLSKEKFLEAFSSFKLEAAFPDAKANFHSFRVDPFEPNRVWYDSRFVGTHTGPFASTIQATGIRVTTPPQASSMTFNARGECTQLTVGYVMDKNVGNTGGLGGVFGILYAIGYALPFPEAQPWSMSLQYNVFTQLGNYSSDLQKFIAGFNIGGADK